MYHAAAKLARSGKVRDWKSIQDKLVEAGYRRAPELLDNSEIRPFWIFAASTAVSLKNRKSAISSRSRRTAALDYETRGSLIRNVAPP